MKTTPPTIKTYLWSASTKLTSPVAVGLHKVNHKDHETTLHSGMFYRTTDSKVWVLHLAWHLALKNDDPSKDPWNVVAPGVNPLQLKLVLAHCRNMAKVMPEIPYGLREAASALKQQKVNGQQVYVFAPQQGESGLTCSTFVLALFDLAGVKLLDLASWTQRDAAREEEDTKHQAWLVEMLRKHNANDQANAIEANQELGSLRYRPEEVGAASGLKAHPASYTQVQPEGAALRQHILTPPPAPKPAKKPRKKPR